MMTETTDIVSIALVRSMLHMLWTGGILYLVLKAVLMVFISERRAELRYYLALFMLFALSSSFFLIFSRLYEPKNGEAVMIFPFNMPGDPGAADISITMDTPPSDSLYKHILTGYFFGLLLFTLRWLAGYFRLETLRRNGIEPDDSDKRMLNDLRILAGLGNTPRIVLSHGLQGPAVWGFIRPTVMVPLGFFTNMPVAQVESLLLHELMHIRRYDHLVNALQCILETTFFFNPFIWLMSREIRLEREKSIDDRVVAISRDPENYAYALYSLSLLRSGELSPGIPASGTAGKPLLNRVKRILNIHIMKTSLRSKLLITGLALFCFSGLFIMTGSALPVFQEGHNKPVPARIVSADTIEHADIDIEMSLLQSADTLTEEEWQRLKSELEAAHAELASIDWEEKIRQIEEEKINALIEVRKKLEMEQEQIRAEIERIDSDEIRRQMEKAAAHLDSLKSNLDSGKLKADMERAMQEMERAISEGAFEDENMRRLMEEQLAVMKDIRFDSLMIEMEQAIEAFDADFDMDFDMDLDIDLEEILTDVEASMEDIDIEELKENINEAMQEIDMEIKKLEEQKKSGKIKK